MDVASILESASVRRESQVGRKKHALDVLSQISASTSETMDAVPGPCA